MQRSGIWSQPFSRLNTEAKIRLLWKLLSWESSSAANFFCPSKQRHTNNCSLITSGHSFLLCTMCSLFYEGQTQLFKCFISSALLHLPEQIKHCGKILDVFRELNREQRASEVLTGNKVVRFRGQRGRCIFQDTFPTHFNILSVFAEAENMQEINSSGCLNVSWRSWNWTKSLKWDTPSFFLSSPTTFQTSGQNFNQNKNCVHYLIREKCFLNWRQMAVCLYVIVYLHERGN